MIDVKLAYMVSPFKQETELVTIVGYLSTKHIAVKISKQITMLRRRKPMSKERLVYLLKRRS